MRAPLSLMLLAALSCTTRYVVPPVQFKNVQGYHRDGSHEKHEKIRLEDSRGAPVRLKKDTYFKLKLQGGQVISGSFEEVSASEELLLVETEAGQHLAIPLSEIEGARLVVPKNPLRATASVVGKTLYGILSVVVLGTTIGYVVLLTRTPSQ